MKLCESGLKSESGVKVHMVLKPMVVFFPWYVKKQIKKRELNYVFNKGRVFSNVHDFSCRVYGKL